MMASVAGRAPPTFLILSYGTLLCRMLSATVAAGCLFLTIFFGVASVLLAVEALCNSACAVVKLRNFEFTAEEDPFRDHSVCYNSVVNFYNQRGEFPLVREPFD